MCTIGTIPDPVRDIPISKADWPRAASGLHTSLAVSNKDEFAKQVREVPQSCVRRLDTNFIHKGGDSRQVSGV